MKWKLFANMATMMVAFLGLGDKGLPVKDQVLDFTDDQKQKLAEAFGPAVNLEEITEKMNAELASIAAEEAKAQDPELINLREEAQKMLKDKGMEGDEAKELLEAKGTSAEEKTLLQGLIASNKEMDASIKKLIKEPVEDIAAKATSMKGVKDLAHSATHLFGSGKAYDAFEGRNWNYRAIDPTAKPTDWAADNGATVEKLQDDINLYYRENPREVNSLFRELTGLPSFWMTRTNVDDQVADGNIVSAEISQARKKGWLPKNKQLIQPEEDKIYPIHIDIEHSGYELQKIETSWLNSLYNREGSQPFKMTFVRFLLMELDKRARLEDRLQATKGVHVATPESATIPGLAIHRGDGIFIKAWRATHIAKKIKTRLLGKPSQENIVDYVKALIEKNVPEEEKNNAGLVLYLSPDWVRSHVERKRILFGHDNNYTGQELVEIENYPNVKMCPLIDLSGTDFMFITYDDNIELMENIPGEKSMYNFDSLKREIFIFADYKYGVRFKHIGTKVKDTDPASFKVQTVWTNGLNPFKDDFYVRLYDNGTGEIKLPYSQITITSDYATSIDTLTGTFEGQIVRIKGNTAVAAAVKVTDEGNITLAGDVDFDLNSGGVLTLRADAGGNLTELKRTTTPPTAPEENTTFSENAIDANDGFTFNFTGVTTTLAEILNGIEGQTIDLFGGANGDLTVRDVAGNIEVTADAVLGDADDTIKLQLIDGVWTEISRTITA